MAFPIHYGISTTNTLNEPTAMRDSLVSHNVPDTCIIEHWQGWRTINSIDAVRNLYDFDSITIISQKYHNERALYQADHFGLNAVGYNAEPSPITSSQRRQQRFLRSRRLLPVKKMPKAIWNLHFGRQKLPGKKKISFLK